MGHEWVERPNGCLNGDGTGTESNGGDTRRGVNATDGLGAGQTCRGKIWVCQSFAMAQIQFQMRWKPSAHMETPQNCSADQLNLQDGLQMTRSSPKTTQVCQTCTHCVAEDVNTARHTGTRSTDAEPSGHHSHWPAAQDRV